MEKDFGEQAHDALCMLVGEAAVQVLAEGRAVTNDSIADMIEFMSDGEPDLIVDCALEMLRR